MCNWCFLPIANGLYGLLLVAMIAMCVCTLAFLCSCSVLDLWCTYFCSFIFLAISLCVAPVCPNKKFALFYVSKQKKKSFILRYSIVFISANISGLIRVSWNCFVEQCFVAMSLYLYYSTDANKHSLVYSPFLVQRASSSIDVDVAAVVVFCTPKLTRTFNTSTANERMNTNKIQT